MTQITFYNKVLSEWWKVQYSFCFSKIYRINLLDLYIELRSNISSLSWDKHIDCRYVPRCKPIIVGTVYINAERQIMMKSIHADKQFMWSNNDELAIAMNWPWSWFLATLNKLICFTNHWYISTVDICYAFDMCAALDIFLLYKNSICFASETMVPSTKSYWYKRYLPA